MGNNTIKKYMMETVKEWAKIILFFILLLSFLTFLISITEEKPHKVIIEGREYIRMKEWTGREYQIILLPVDSIKE